MSWIDTIINAHLTVTDAVSHAQHMQGDRYFVWQEDGYKMLNADDVHTERVITGSTDLFTKNEFDVWVDELQDSFDASGIAWSLNSIQYEEDTGFFHYEWYWEVI